MTHEYVIVISEGDNYEESRKILICKSSVVCVYCLSVCIISTGVHVVEYAAQSPEIRAHTGFWALQNLWSTVSMRT